MIKELEQIKAQLPKIDGSATCGWKIGAVNNVMTVTCSNGTRDYLPPFEIKPPKGWQLIDKSCIEDDDRWTKWNWKFIKLN